MMWISTSKSEVLALSLKTGSSPGIVGTWSFAWSSCSNVDAIFDYGTDSWVYFSAWEGNSLCASLCWCSAQIDPRHAGGAPSWPGGLYFVCKSV